METVQAAFFAFKSSLHFGMGGKRWAEAAWVWRRNAMPTVKLRSDCGGTDAAVSKAACTPLGKVQAALALQTQQRGVAFALPHEFDAVRHVHNGGGLAAAPAAVDDDIDRMVQAVLDFVGVSQRFFVFGQHEGARE